MPKDDTITIKIKRETHSDLRVLIDKLTAQGWASVGLNRTDAPTFATVVDASVQLLSENKPKKR